MKARLLAPTYFALLAGLMILPMTMALAQNSLVSADVDTAIPNASNAASPPAATNAQINVAVLEDQLANMIAKAQVESVDIQYSFAHEVDINQPPATDGVSSATPDQDPNSKQSQYIQLTQNAGNELTAKQYSAAANDFQQAATLYPGRLAAVLREAIAFALAGDEDKATDIASKLSVVGDPQTCQAVGKLLDAIEAAKDGSAPPPQAAPAPEPEIASVPAPPVVQPEAAPLQNGPSTIDTLSWIVDKLNGLPNRYTSSTYGFAGVAHMDDFNYGFVQTGLLITHKNVWRLADSTPVITTDTIDLDVSKIATVRLDVIDHGNMFGASAITVTTFGDDVSIHRVIKDVGNPWNPRTNFDTNEQLGSDVIMVVSDPDIAQRIVKALQHIVDLNATTAHHDMF